MTDWDTRWPEARPRWGTYSVKSHQELSSVIADLLMYDVLVFPCPDSEDEFRRWEDSRWDPELLALRVTQLGDHAAVIPWNALLREAWRAAWETLSPEDRQRPEAAFNLTAAMTAEQPLSALLGAEDDRLPNALLDPPRVHPAFEQWDAQPRARVGDLELVAAFSSEAEAMVLTGSGARHGLPDNAWLDLPADVTGLRLRLRLEVPDDADEQSLFDVLDLVEDDDFQRARRRLWTWEESLPPDVDPLDAVTTIEALVGDYNAAVRRGLTATRQSLAFLIVPALIGAGIDAVTGGLVSTVVGIGSLVVMDRVKSRFPLLSGGAQRASHHPGSALAGMLAISGHAG